MKIKLLLICLAICCIAQTKAQEKQITLRKDSVLFTEVIKELEEQSSFRFFFKLDWVDTLMISVEANNLPIDRVIKEIGKQVNLTPNQTDENTIVFTKGYRIKTTYAHEYGDYLNRKRRQTKDTIKYVAPTREEDEKKITNLEYLTFKIGSPSVNPHLKEATIQGTVRDMETGEPLIGTVIYFDELKKGDVTNTYGFYSITVPKGQYRVEYRSLGMRTTHRNVVIHSDGKLDVEMKSSPHSINEVTVRADGGDKVKSLRMGMEKVTMKSLKQLPGGFGEADVIKGTLLLPGVQAVSEASAGFNVRGGGTDQNLILLGGAPIMNTSHFFGFFSGFNADLVKDITLYKSGVPAKYGGRASSVMDITLKEGNRKSTKVFGGISPVSGRVTIDSPIKKDKSSFVLGARSTYSNWVLKLLDDVRLKNSSANFHDVQGNFSVDLDDKNSLYVSGYYSHDDFDYYSEDAYDYNSLASSVKWKKIFSPKLFSTFTALTSMYDYALDSRGDSASMYQVKYRLNQYGIKSDFTYHSSFNHKIDFGLNSTYYHLAPGERTPLGNKSVISYKKLEDEQALETSFYVNDEFDLTHFMGVSVGLRYSAYANFGPKSQVNYLPGHARQVDYVQDTASYKRGQVIQFYHAPEFRFSANVKLSNSASVKLGIGRMKQYIQMISNTASMSPTDIWKLSDKYIKPQRSDQYSVGYYQKMGKSFEFTAESYYKNLKNILDYKGGAELVMNSHLETDVLNGNGYAYGAEFMVKKKRGDLTGWINYTYSRVFHKVKGNYPEEVVNNGDYFPANYDKPHDLKIVTNYKMSRRLNVSSNFFWGSGRPYTAPVAYYEFNGAYRPYYTERNALRMEDYVRLDFAVTLNGNLVKKKLNHSSWTLSLYNALGRKNPYSIFFRTEGEQVKGYKMSIYGRPILTLTYNYKIFGNAKDDF